MSLRTEIRRLERRVQDLSPINTYAGLDRDPLRIKLDELRVLQIEARAFLRRLREGGAARKTASALSDAATVGGFTVFVGGTTSIPLFVAVDAAAGGVLTTLGLATSVALKVRTRYLRKAVERLETLQDEIRRHIVAVELAAGGL